MYSCHYPINKNLNNKSPFLRLNSNLTYQNWKNLIDFHCMSKSVNNMKSMEKSILFDEFSRFM